MAAGDSLSHQFEIVHPHRSVRIGDRMYPASHTDAEFNSASIPMENGNLVHVRPADLGPKPSNVYHLSSPTYSVTAPHERTKVAKESYGMSHVGTAHGTEDLQRSLDSLGKIHLDDDARAHNSRVVQFQRDKMID